MSQFQYKDLNKFFASIGVFLIGLTFLLPWLFLQESFNLQIKTEELKVYTQTAQEIITQQQDIVSILYTIIPIISICSFLGGFYFLFFKGVRGWKKWDDANEQMEALRKENQQLQNKKLTIELEQYLTSNQSQQDTLTIDKEQNATSENEKSSLNIPINNSWELNHWGSEVAEIKNGEMIFSGKRTRLETDGCHVNLSDILEIGSFYRISCFVKASANTTGKFQLWCHDNIGVDPHGYSKAIQYATPSTTGERCSLRFEAKFNRNIRIHLQYLPGDGQITVSDIRVTKLEN